MGDTQTSQHQLWVNLSALGDGNVFALLPQLTKNMLEDENDQRPFNNEQLLYDLVLPSDDVWQAKTYYKLVEKQRVADAVNDQQEDNQGEKLQKHQMDHEEEPAKLHDWLIKSKRHLSTECERLALKSDIKALGNSNVAPITWTVGDIAKAGRLLGCPPLPVTFEDEQEMRRVYTLIYDVFRYKNALSQALDDIAFFLIFPELKSSCSHVWLLFYDLYHRAFKKRDTAVASNAIQLFAEANLTSTEGALWKLRTKLAASVSRLRIKHKALNLCELLPLHLRDGKVSGQASNKPVTCWINLIKIKNIAHLKKLIENTLEVTLVEEGLLGPKNYIWDRHCPQIVAFHESLRTSLAKSELIQKCQLVLQDKSFCLGPATFHKQILSLELSGSVIQTHINSPRTTAYLATILSQNEKIHKLLAFSAGRRKFEYESYFNKLGMKNVSIFEDRLIDVSPDSSYMEDVVAVFATPPNSYSAVNDPIDLVCSRGGDLTMLEVLTETDASNERKSRACSILEEQRRTLQFAMSRPQIQFVLYETHSELDAENTDMIEKTVNDVNKIAKLHHASLQGIQLIPKNIQEVISLTTIETTSSAKKEVNNNESLQVILDPFQSETAECQIESNISVPDTDVFEVPNLPNLCPNENESCLDLVKEGCFLALVQRKQIIRLDNKYMIQMAENRGLFGKVSTSSTRSNKRSKGSRKTPDPNSNKSVSQPRKYRRKMTEAEIARIAAPTHTYLRHSVLEEATKCARCAHNIESQHYKAPIYKQWWSQATRHIINLRSSLIKNKVIPSVSTSKGTGPKAIVSNFMQDKYKVDEIVAQSRRTDSLPIFPKLKLTRLEKLEKEQLQLPITVLKFS